MDSASQTPVLPPSPHAMPRRDIELDFLRGIAILMVLDYHAPVHWLSLPFHLLGFPNFGWAGVDIFFVLSGFLVGGLLMREWKSNRRIDHRRFLIRRGFKIWPQYYVFLAIMLLTGHRSFHELRGNLLNIQNYTGGIPHTWSLAVEEHAYLLLVAALVLAARLRLRMRALFAVFGAVAVLVPTLRFYLALHGHEVANRTHTRIDGIALGVLLAVLFHFAPAAFRRAQHAWPAWIALAAAALLVLRFQVDRPWSASLGWNAADLLGVALLMLLYRPSPPAGILSETSETKEQQLRPPPSEIRDPSATPQLPSRPHRPAAAFFAPAAKVGTYPPKRSLPYRLIAWIGVYSYGIYLWHVAVISPTVAIAAHLPPRLAPVWLALAPICAGIALGSLFTALVELPALRLRDRLFPRRSGPPVPTPASAPSATLDPAELTPLSI